LNIHRNPARRVLLCVTGLSPQIVTETLYALAVAGRPPWLPTEIHLVTTARGAENARLKLLSDEPGWFHRVCRDYGLTGIAFPPQHIHVIQRADGSMLDDIRDDADNQLAADYITEIVRGLTADKTAEIHASIAGGRKTMGFYLGYAMSLYGRAQDRLSHVLVSAPYESHPEFYYPTPQTRVIETLDRAQDALDTSQARVFLGDIPFVRLRNGLTPELLSGSARFSDVVAEAQKALPPTALEVDPEHGLVRAGGEEVRLPPAALAFYWLLAERARDGRPGLHWSDKGLEAELGSFYARLVNPNSGLYERFETHAMSRENFHARKRHINTALEKFLGKRRAAPYLIQVQSALPGKGRCQPYALELPPTAITIRAASLPVQHEYGDVAENTLHRNS
jgi:CRISPR-associated protein (TIGR02584 family)